MNSVCILKVYLFTAQLFLTETSFAVRPFLEKSFSFPRSTSGSCLVPALGVDAGVEPGPSASSAEGRAGKTPQECEAEQVSRKTLSPN